MEACAELSDAQLEATTPGTAGCIREEPIHITDGEQYYVMWLSGRLVTHDERYGWPGREVLRRELDESGSALVELAWRADPNEVVIVEAFEVPLVALYVQAIDHATEHRSRSATMTIMTQQGIEPPDCSGWAWGEWPGSLRHTDRTLSRACRSRLAQRRVPQGESRMDPVLPVACSVSEEQERQRREELSRDLLSAATSVREFENRFEYAFRGDPHLAEAIVRSIIEERDCCRFLTFELTLGSDLGPILLRIRGPEGTKQFLTGAGRTQVEPKAVHRQRTQDTGGGRHD